MLVRARIYLREPTVLLYPPTHIHPHIFLQRNALPPKLFTEITEDESSSISENGLRPNPLFFKAKCETDMGEV
jgi:hypothetical protein